jgi:hypothetical protein
MGFYEFWYGIAGLVVGATCVLAGAILVYVRRQGSDTWRIRVGPAHIDIATATPGVVLAAIGFLIVYVTRSP